MAHRFLTPRENLRIYLGQVSLTLKYLIFNSKVQQLDLVTVVTETIETVYNSGLRVIVQYIIFYLLAICIVMVSESVEALE